MQRVFLLSVMVRGKATNQGKFLARLLALVLPIFLVSCGGSSSPSGDYIDIKSVHINSPESPTVESYVTLSGEFNAEIVFDGLGTFSGTYTLIAYNELTGRTISNDYQYVVRCTVIIIVPICGIDPGHWTIGVQLEVGDNPITVSISSEGTEAQATVVVNHDPDLPPPTVLPTVVSVFPESLASDVGIYTQIFVTFSDEMDSSSISTDTINVCLFESRYHANCIFRDNVDVRVEYSDLVATITPILPFENSARYGVEILPAARNLAGGHLHQSYSWSFVTEGTASP